MMTRVCALDEIPTSIPISEENPRRFKIDISILQLVDFDKAMAARTFEANVIWPNEMTPEGKGEIEQPTILVEMFFPSGLTVVTLMDGKIERGLRGFNEIYDDTSNKNDDDEYDDEDDDDGIVELMNDKDIDDDFTKKQMINKEQ